MKREREEGRDREGEREGERVLNIKEDVSTLYILFLYLFTLSIFCMPKSLAKRDSDTSKRLLGS